MKSINRFLAAMIAVIMIMAMLPTAFAATIAPAADDDHAYEAYQIFVGDLDDDGNLTNIKWGANANKGTYTGEYVPKEVLDELTGVKSGTDAAKLAVIKKYVNLSSSPTTVSGSTTVDNGYYLIKDKDTHVGEENESVTLYIVEVAGAVTIAPKTGVPSLEKKVKETNDTTGDVTGWQDGADYDIGDNVPFKLTATLPAEYGKFEHYVLTFEDTMSAGLTYTEGSNTYSAYYQNNGEDPVSLTVSFTKEGQKLTWKTGDLKAVSAITKDTKVVIEFDAQLNSSAVIGPAGNENKAGLKYTNNPNWDGNGDSPDGKTPEDKVIVFTYQVDSNKVDGNNNSLTGAKFELFKYVPNGGTETNQKLTDAGVAAAEIKNWKSLGEVDGASKSLFSWTGVDAGKYMLVETQAPEGYNAAEPIVFTVTATYDVESATPGFGNLTTDNDNVVAVQQNGSLTGAVTTTVKNFMGAELPTTGGMGTTLFYIVGGILVVGAGILLVSKKRMSDMV